MHRATLLARVRALSGALVFSLVASLAGSACGGDDGGGAGGDVTPGAVRFDDLRRGVWVSDPTVDGNTPRTLQFLTAAEARALYGNSGVPGVGGAVVGAAWLDDMLAAFGPDDPMLIQFPRGGGQVQDVYAVRVRDGVVSLSRLGEQASNVTDGVLFEWGFTQPVDVPIERFVRGESLVLAQTPAAGAIASTYNWAEDCRWTGRAGWVWTATNGLENDTIPVVASTLTRAGEFVGYFSHKRGQTSSQFWRNGGCPIGSRLVLPIRTGNVLVPWGERDAAVLYHDESGLRGGVVNEATAETLAGVAATVDGRIEGWRFLDSTTLVVLEQSERDRTGFFLPMQRTILRNLTDAEPWPLPAIDPALQDVAVRLMPDGRATYTAKRPLLRDAPAVFEAGIEVSDGVWEAVSLVGTTDDGRQVDLSDPEVGASAWIDADGRVTALVRASAVIPALHPGRRVDPKYDALVRLEDGRATVHMLPSSTRGQFMSGSFLRRGRADLDAHGTFYFFSQLDEREEDESRLTVTRWPVSEAPTVQAVSVGVQSVFEESGFFDNAIYRGTPFASQPHMALNDDGSVLVSDGWARTFVRPADALMRSERYSVTFTLQDAPAGARLTSTHAPAVDCTDTCTVEVDRGTIFGLTLDVPPGWAAKAPESARCTTRELDNGYCFVVAEDDGEHVFTFAQTPIDAQSTATGGWWFLDAVAGSDGVFAARIGSGGGLLPDGTEVTDASNTSPAEALTFWSATKFDWLRRIDASLPLRAWAFTPSGDVVALHEGVGGVRDYDDPQLGSLPIRAGQRLVVELSAATGDTRSAHVLAYPQGLAVYAEGLDAGGRVLVVADTLRAIDDAATGLTLDTGRRVVLLWGDDGRATVLSDAPTARHVPGARYVQPLGDTHAVAVTPSADGARVEIVGGDGSLASDLALTLSVGGATLSTDALRFDPRASELLVSFLADGDAQVGDRSLPGSVPAVIVFALNAEGEVSDAVRLDLPEASYDTRPRAATRLHDGRLMAATNRGRFGQEALMVEDLGAVAVGPAFVPSGTLSGYETRSLTPLADGRVVWTARHWGGQVIRPYAMLGSFAAVLAPDRLLATQDMLERPEELPR